MKNIKQVNFYRTLWGYNLDLSTSNSITNTINNLKKSGFKGFEIATAFFDYSKLDNFKKICNDLDFEIIAQIHTDTYPVNNSDIKFHLDDYKRKVDKAIEIWNPVLINSHTGRDDWNLNDNIEFFKQIENFDSYMSIPISHETHRQRILNNPNVGYQILKNCKNLKITLDLSHWVLASERFLNSKNQSNWNELIDMVSEQTYLIHARIGLPNQIQAIDPFVKNTENNEALEFYSKIWKQIQTKTRADTLRIDIEYGPSPYQIIDPNTEKPFTELDSVINSTKKYLDNLFDIKH